MVCLWCLRHCSQMGRRYHPIRSAAYKLFSHGRSWVPNLATSLAVPQSLWSPPYTTQIIRTHQGPARWSIKSCAVRSEPLLVVSSQGQSDQFMSWDGGKVIMKMMVMMDESHAALHFFVSSLQHAPWKSSPPNMILNSVSSLSSVSEASMFPVGSWP